MLVWAEFAVSESCEAPQVKLHVNPPWVDAADLKLGEHVLKSDGSYGVVKSIIEVKHEQKMYNLTVEKDHTFFVGDGEWLVHNTSIRCSAGQPDPDDKLGIWSILWNFRRGNRLARLNATEALYNVPPGMSVDDIPILDSVGDTLQSYANDMPFGFSLEKLSLKVIDKLEGYRMRDLRGELNMRIRFDLLLRREAGYWVEHQILENSRRFDLVTTRRGQSGVDAQGLKNLNYDVMSDTDYSLLRHGRRANQAGLMVRYIYYPRIDTQVAWDTIIN